MTISDSPVRLSPLHSLHVTADAVFTGVAGWQMVQQYGDVDEELRIVGASAGVCDITGRSLARVKSFDLESVLGEMTIEVGSVVRDGERVIARLTPEEALVIGAPAAGTDWSGGIEPEGEPARYITDVTSGLTALRIVGPRAREVISLLTDLDVRDGSMPDGSSSQAGFAEVHGTLLRLDVSATPAYELYVARELGAYVWDAVLESLGHGEVVPFGNEVLVRLEQGD